MVSASGISPLDGAREELLREASIEAEASGREKAREEGGPARSLLVFFLGAEGFAVDLAHVRKVLRPSRIARVSGANVFRSARIFSALGMLLTSGCPLPSNGA